MRAQKQTAGKTAKKVQAKPTGKAKKEQEAADMALVNALHAKGEQVMQAFSDFVENRKILCKHGIKFRITFGWNGKEFCDFKQGEADLLL